MSQLLKVPEVAERLACAVTHVYALIAKQALRSVPIGLGRNGLRVRAEDLEAFIQSRLTGKVPDWRQPATVKLRHLR